MCFSRWAVHRIFPKAGAVMLCTRHHQTAPKVRTVPCRGLIYSLPVNLVTCCYQLQYTEENQRSKHTPWSFRHTAVYHHHDSASNFDLFILLHSIEDSYLEQQLISLTKPGPRSQSMLRTLLADPSNLHLLIASSYVNNWRWYLRYVGQSFEDKVSYHHSPPSS